MATVTLKVPDALLRRARKRLGGNGTADVKEYLLRSLEAVAEEEGSPIDKETEAKLLKGLESPLLRMTAAGWAKKLGRYEARHRKSKRA